MGRLARSALVPVFCLGALLVAPAAFAQVGSGVALNRPAEVGPSSRIGLLGGRYTRDPVVGLRGVQVHTLGGSGLSLRPRSSHAESEAAPYRLGMIVAPYGPALLLEGDLADWQLREFTGFAAAVRIDTPLYGWGGMQSAQPVNWSLPRIEPGGTEFQRFFGLAAPVAEHPDGAPLTSADVVAAVEDRTRQLLQSRETEAVTLFRQATSGAAEAQETQMALRRLSHLLSKLRAMDAAAHLPCLLHAQVAIERGHFSLALNNLVALAQRKPEYFVDAPQVATYYGDYSEQTRHSNRLETRMRTVFDLARGVDTVDGRMLEAYCALVLGDKPRARLALEKAERLLKEGRTGPTNSETLLSALRYAAE